MVQIEIAQQLQLAKTLAQTLYFQGETMELALLVEADEGADAAGGFDLIQLDLVDLLGARGGLLGLGGIGGEAADEGLQLGDLRLLLGVVGVQTFARLGGGGHIVVVVARVDAQLAVIQIGHVGADGIQEMAVMGDDDHGAVALVEQLFQPADGVDVQVVGGLVQQHDLGIGEQHLRQQHAQLPARRHRAHRAGVLFDRDAQAQQQLAGAGLGGVAVQFAEDDLQLGHAHAVFFAHVGKGVDAVALLLHFPQLGVAHDHRVEHRVGLEGELVLAQLAQPFVGVDADIAGSGLEVAAEDLHQGRFAAAVGADQAVAIAVAELDRDVLEQGLGAELHGDICCRNQCDIPKIE